MELFDLDDKTEIAMQLLRNLVDQFPLGCACYQSVFNENDEIIDYIVLDVNASFEALSGQNKAAVVGKTVSEAYKTLQPEIIGTLRSLGNELLSKNEKSLVLYFSALNRAYRATLIFVQKSMILGIYESVQAQVYRRFLQRSGVSQRIADKKPVVIQRAQCAATCEPDNPAKPGGAEEGTMIICPELCDFSEDRDAPIYDSLTGLYDRPFAVEALKAHIAQGTEPLSIVLGDVNGLKLINDALGYKAGDEILIGIAQTLRENCREGDLVARWSDDEFLLLLPYSSSAETQVVLKRLRGALERKCASNRCTTMTFGYATSEESVRNAESLVDEAEMWVQRKKLLEIQSSRNSIIKLLLSTLHAKSAETQEHSDRIADHCRRIAVRLGLSDEMINDLVLLSMLHDIGKVGIRHEILNKPGPLTPEERREIELHPEIGYRITQSIPELSHVSQYILAHHEWWNGKGYPNGLRGEEIPLPSRIIAAVDAYDVMITGRVYKAARSKEEAAAELTRFAGSQFDPNIAAILVERIRSDA